MRSTLHHRRFARTARVATTLAAVVALTLGLTGAGSAGAGDGSEGTMPDAVQPLVSDSSIEPGFSAEKASSTERVAQEQQFEVLQLNLCNSGRNDDCYEGGASIPYAGNYIRYLAPRTVTLNEICRDDIDPLYEAFRDGWQRRSEEQNWWTFWVYRAVEVQGGGEPKTCANDELYVVAVMGYIPDSEHTGLEYLTGVYDDDSQWLADEWRVWACAYPGSYITCTTHLTNDTPEIAHRQCIDLTFDEVIPHEVWGAFGEQPTTIGADFNLFYLPDYRWDVQTCVPAGWFRKGDGRVQHVMASDAYSPAGDAIVLDMGGTTDHPALLVVMTKN